MAGSLAILAGVGAVAVGTVAVVFDRTQRDARGYLATLPAPYVTSTYALVFDSYRTGLAGDVLVPREMLGTVRIVSHSAQPVFVGIGPAAAVDAYLMNVEREVLPRFDGTRSGLRVEPGRRPTTLPSTHDFWVASASGRGTQSLDWSPRNGSWRVVVMNANGSSEVDTELTIRARFPDLLAVGVGLLSGGLLLTVLGRAVFRAGRSAT